VKPTERHVFAVNQSPFDVPGQQAVLPRQVVQMLLERLVLELDGLHDFQIFEQVRFVVVFDSERRLSHQIRDVRLVEFVQRFRVVHRHRRSHVRRRRQCRRLLGGPGMTKCDVVVLCLFYICTRYCKDQVFGIFRNV